MKRGSPEQPAPDPDRERAGKGAGLAGVYAAALGAACCLAVPLVVALLGGSAGAVLSGGGSDLITLAIIGFAIGGVLAVVMSIWRDKGRRGPGTPECRDLGQRDGEI